MFGTFHRILKLASVVMLLGAVFNSWAAGIVINQPAHGTELLATSGFYDAVDQTINVQGAVTGLAPGTLGDYRVLINGFAVGVFGGGTGGIANFRLALPVGPLPPPGMTSWPAWVPYLNHFTNIEAINLPMLAELYHIPSQRVVARYRVVVVDKRWDDDMDLHAHGGLNESGALELTERGLVALQPAHASSLPQPGLVEFNADLTEAFAGSLETVFTDTDYGSSTKVCVAAEDVPGLTATQTYQNAWLEAELQHQLYQAAEDTCENGSASTLAHLLPGWGTAADAAVRAAACIAKNTYCVRERPQNNRFEVCVSQVEGVGQSLSIAGVDSVELALSDNTNLEVQTFLQQVDGEIDVALKDLFIRWDVEHAGCVARPQVSMDEAERLTNSSIAAWSSCPTLHATAHSAQTPTAQAHSVYPGLHPERLKVEADLAPDRLFELSPELPDTELGSDTCSESFISDDVDTLLGKFYDPMREKLDETWDAGNPDTQQAQALDLLLSRFETGVFGDMSDVIVDLEIKRLKSGLDRLRGKYDSNAHLRPNTPVFTGSEFVYSPPSDFPCEGGALVLGGACSDSRNFYDAEFDVSYSVTTGTLNQVIGQRYPTQQMFRSLTPVCAELGLPSGCGPDDMPVLDGTSLASLHGSLAGLGATQVAIEMKPTMVPFTWIHPDPPNPPGAGRGEVTYQLGQYQVDFVGDSAGPDGTTLWLSVIVDFFAPQLELDVARIEDANEIVAALGDNVVWHYTIVKSQLAGCPLIPQNNAVPGYLPLPCEGELTSAIGDLVEPELHSALHAMVSQHPAPQMFDAAGEATDEKVFEQTDKFQWGQVITFYGDLVD